MALILLMLLLRRRLDSNRCCLAADSPWGSTSQADPRLPVHIAHRSSSGRLPDRPGKIAHAESTACGDRRPQGQVEVAAQCATGGKFVQNEMIVLSAFVTAGVVRADVFRSVKC